MTYSITATTQRTGVTFLCNNTSNLRTLRWIIDRWTNQYRSTTLIRICKHNMYGKLLVSFDLDNHWIFDIWYQQEQLNASNSN